MNRKNSLRVAIVGCGVVALDHLETVVSAYKPSELHLCDTNLENARRMSARISNRAVLHENAEELFSGGSLDVVHILTPPDSHYNLAAMALRAGAHVLVEKPMALSVHETEDLFDIAESAGRQVCAGHSLLHMPCVRRAFSLLESGVLGRIISASCFFGHAERRRTIPYGDAGHWAYRIPGGVLTNVVSHPASLIVELIGEPEAMFSHTSARNVMPGGLPDLLQVTIQGRNGYGSFMISMAHGNASRRATIECERGTLDIDLARQLMVWHKHRGRLGPVSKVLGGIGTGLSYVTGTVGNTWKVATKQLKRNPGTRALVLRFYESVHQLGPNPISKENTLAVARIIEHVIESSSVSPPESDIARGVTYRHPAVMRPPGPRLGLETSG